MTVKTAVLPEGLRATKYLKFSKKTEWEHVVPAENFGRSFIEWRDGDDSCLDSKGKSVTGCKSASK
ncbi:hypothetical protein [Psychromonas sp. L1A2]|uniref:hypothetical protein n=1 Tax=Psychromonas sp. L1A2 TaxID=2686356 RepID=UPI001357C423|nr:hypothetical protein [Psychromonas sp. L1A2]